MEVFKVISGSIFAAVAYGILQDQVTARVCVEYFTVGHPDLFRTDSPTLLAFGWGVVATWWAGLLLGIPLALAARAGSNPKRGIRDLAPAIVRLLVCMGASATACGILGYLAARVGLVWLVEPYASAVRPERHALFLADGAAHLAAYGVGFAGGISVCIWTWMKRKQPSMEASEYRAEGNRRGKGARRRPFSNHRLGAEMWNKWDPGHPYRWRTWLRGRLPWCLIDLGLAQKGADCERSGGTHWWYNRDNETSGCYHCQTVRLGRLWEERA